MICRAIPYEGKEPYIFVSYCHKDRESLYPIFEQMVLDGYRMWYDDGNHAGDDWLDNIENHLEDCKVVVAFISGNSSLSHNCKSEVVFALKCKKKVIPVLIDSEELPKGLRMQLSHLHYLKSADFATNSALLNKVYEAEECKECKAPSGSLQLRPEPKPNPEPPVTPPKKDPPPQTSSPEVKPDKPEKLKDKKKHVIKIPVTKKPRKTEAEPIPEPEKGPETTPEKTPAAEPPEIPDNGDKTVIQTVIPDNTDEPTVYGGPDITEPTILGGPGTDIDPTVRVDNRALALLLHPAAERAYKLKKPQTKLGRSPIKCDVVIEGNESISKLHAEIRQYKQACYLVDMDSANGTFLNGEQLEAGKQVPLDNPAIFQLNDETLILMTGLQARKLIAQGSVAFLMNADSSAIRVLENDTMPLNRNNKWPDGTLSDPKVHRAAHALLRRKDDGVYLVDESPEGGNGTHHNGSRLKHGEERLLENGDQIRLGDTTLTFVSITI